MKCKVLSMAATLVVSSFLIGCSTAAKQQMDYTAVSVRFIMPPEPEVMAETSSDSEARLATDASYDGFADPNDTYTSASDVYHVALWGDAFAGDDVTHGVTSLQPGAYTFAFLDRENSDMMQGWLEINQERHNLLDFLYTWKNQIPQQKRQFAYEFEIRSQANRSQPDVFGGFTKQLEALDRLDRQLDKMIKAEVSAQTDRRQQTYQLFQNAELRILPGGDPVFHPATRAAFNDSDMATVRKGDPVTKFVLLADHEDAQWKLRCVNQLYNELNHCKAVMREAANRFERQKGLFLLTDHLYPNDSRFVENEIHLQSTLEVVEQLDEQMSDLRHRRLALAFISGLIAPKDHFRALDKEEQEMMRERVVLDTEGRRLDLLVEKADESQIRRVGLERQRQRVMAAIHDLDQHIEDMWAAHRSLETMITSKSVIHRQGDQRLLAATLVGGGLPFDVRQAVESESVMTVRLEKSDNVFIPTESGTDSSVTRARRPARYDAHKVTQRETRPQVQMRNTSYAAPVVTQRTADVQAVKPVRHQTQSVVSHKTSVQKQQVVQHRKQAVGQHKTKVHQKKPVQNRARKIAQRKSSYRGTKARHKSLPTFGQTRKVTGRKERVPQMPTTQKRRRPVISKHVNARTTQPKRFKARLLGPSTNATVQGKMPGQQTRQLTARWANKTVDEPTPQRGAQFVGQQDTTQQGQYPSHTGEVQVDRQGCELPFFIKMLVPPCWFLEPVQKDARVANYKEPQETDGQSKTKGCELPFFIKMLVPPCWFLEPVQKDTSVVDVMEPTTQQGRAFRTADTDPGKSQSCELPWFIQLLVPPCWFAEPVQKDARLADFEEPPVQKKFVKTADVNEQDDKGCELPWFIKVLVPPCWFYD